MPCRRRASEAHRARERPAPRPALRQSGVSEVRESRTALARTAIGPDSPRWASEYSQKSEQCLLGPLLPQPTEAGKCTGGELDLREARGHPLRRPAGGTTFADALPTRLSGHRVIAAARAEQKAPAFGPLPVGRRTQPVSPGDRQPVHAGGRGFESRRSRHKCLHAGTCCCRLENAFPLLLRTACAERSRAG